MAMAIVSPPSIELLAIQGYRHLVYYYQGPVVSFLWHSTMRQPNIYSCCKPLIDLDGLNIKKLAVPCTLVPVISTIGLLSSISGKLDHIIEINKNWPYKNLLD